MKQQLLSAVGLSILTFSAASAVAQSPASAEDDVLVVYGTRLEQTLAESGTAITVITREDLDRLASPFAIDALATAPGVTLNQTGDFGGAASIRIRGASSDQTLVLIDGVPVGDQSSPGGGFDFARLDTDQIERIEVLRGPQSTIWGSEAIGGVVSITTRQPRENDVRLHLFGEVGSFDSYRGGARGRLGGTRHNLTIASTASVSDGFSKADEAAGNIEDDGYRSHTLSLQQRSDFGALLLDASLYAQSAETEFDSFDFLAPGSIADGDERAESDEFNGHISFRTRGNRRLQHRLLAGFSQIDRSNFVNETPAFDADGERNILRYELRGDGFALPVSFVVSAERDGREANGDDTSITSGFGLLEWKPIDSITLTGGLRTDDHEQFGSETTSRLSASWQTGTNVTLRANWGEGFKAPSLFQQTFFCCGATAVPQDIRPERSDGFDVGALISFENAQFEIGYFELNTDDLIDFSFALGGFENIARAETQGIEAGWTVELAPNIHFRGSYTWLEAEDGNGNALSRLPEHSADGSLSYVTDRFSLSFATRFNGEEQESFGTVEAWTRFDASASWRLNDRLEIYARAENLTDTDYQQVFGYGTAGRSGTIGLRLKK